MRVRLQVRLAVVVILSATLLLNLVHPDHMRQPHSSTLACSTHGQIEGEELYRDDLVYAIMQRVLIFLGHVLLDISHYKLSRPLEAF